MGKAGEDGETRIEGQNALDAVQFHNGDVHGIARRDNPVGKRDFPRAGGRSEGVIRTGRSVQMEVDLDVNFLLDRLSVLKRGLKFPAADGFHRFFIEPVSQSLYNFHVTSSSVDGNGQG